MKIIEDRFITGADGSLTLSGKYLKEMGIGVDNEVTIAFLADSNEKNAYREFYIGGLGPLEDEQAEIQIPTELMQKAGLSYDDDLNIVCLDGAILICRDTLLNDKELSAVMDSMEIAADIVSRLPKNPDEASQCLEDATEF